MKKTVIYISLIIVFLKGSVCALETIIIGVLDFPPFYNVVEGQKPSGYLTDYLIQITDRAGYGHQVFGYPAKRIFRQLNEGNVHLSAGIKRPDAYGNNVIFSSKKITDIEVKLFTRMDTLLLETKEELKEKRILVIAGYSYGGLLSFLQDPANNIVLDTSNDHDLMFKKLFAKRADYLLDYARPSKIVLEKMGSPDIQSKSIVNVPIYLILSQKTPGLYEVMARLEKASDEINREELGILPAPVQ